MAKVGVLFPIDAAEGFSTEDLLQWRDCSVVLARATELEAPHL